MTDTDFETRLARSLQARAENAVEPFDAGMIADAAIAASRPRPGFLRMALAAAVVVALAVVGTAGAIVVGDLLNPSPAPSLPVIPSPDASARPSTPAEAGQLVYTRRERLENGEAGCVTRFVFCHRSSVVIANADGTDERELVPGPASVLIAASADGSRLLVGIPEADGYGLFLTDSTGSTPQRLDIPCEVPCYQPGDWGFAFSPDGTRLAFRRAYVEGLDAPPWQVDTPLIAIVDLATGAVDELESTLGYGNAPGWSPDGSRLAFANHVVDADGSNFQQIAPASLFTGISGEFTGSLTPSQWSPDGSLIVLTSYNDTLTTEPRDNSQRLMDIYVVRPDGSGLQRLTHDTGPPLGTSEPGDFGAAFPTWTRDGRITFTRLPMPPETEYELWVMDADGSDATRLDPADLAALTALGCVACTYPPLGDLDVPGFAYWIPGQ